MRVFLSGPLVLLLASCLPEVIVTNGNANPPVEGLEITDTGEGGVLQLTWTPPQAERLTGIRVLRDADGFPGLLDEDTDLVEDLPAEATGFRDTGLPDVTQQFYAVFTSYEDGSFSAPVNVSETPTDGVGPVIESFDAFADPSGDFVNLAWTVAGGEASFRSTVLREGAVVGSPGVGETSTRDIRCGTGVPPPAECYELQLGSNVLSYTLEVTDGSGNSATLETSATVVDSVGPEARVIVAEALESGGARISWGVGFLAPDWIRAALVRVPVGTEPVSEADGTLVDERTNRTSDDPNLERFISVDANQDGSWWAFDYDEAGNVSRSVLSASLQLRGEVGLLWSTAVGTPLSVVRHTEPELQQGPELVICPAAVTSCIDDPPLDGRRVFYSLVTAASTTITVEVESAPSVLSASLITGDRGVQDGEQSIDLNVTTGHVAVVTRGVPETPSFPGALPCGGTAAIVLDDAGAVVSQACASTSYNSKTVRLLDDDSLLVAGTFQGNIELIDGVSPVMTANGPEAAFLARIASDGTAVTWQRFLECSGALANERVAAAADDAGVNFIWRCGGDTTIDGAPVSSLETVFLRRDLDGAAVFARGESASPSEVRLSHGEHGRFVFALRFDAGAGTSTIGPGVTVPVSGIAIGELDANGALTKSAILDGQTPGRLHSVAATAAEVFVAMRGQSAGTADFGAVLGSQNIGPQDEVFARLNSAFTFEAIHRYFAPNQVGVRLVPHGDNEVVGSISGELGSFGSDDIVFDEIPEFSGGEHQQLIFNLGETIRWVEPFRLPGGPGNDGLKALGPGVLFGVEADGGSTVLGHAVELESFILSFTDAALP